MVLSGSWRCTFDPPWMLFPPDASLCPGRRLAAVCDLCPAGRYERLGRRVSQLCKPTRGVGRSAESADLHRATDQAARMSRIGGTVLYAHCGPDAVQRPPNLCPHAPTKRKKP